MNPAGTAIRLNADNHISGVILHHQWQVNVRRDKLVSADIVASLLRAGITVDVGCHARVHTGVNRRRTGANVIETTIRVRKGRIDPNVDTAGDDLAVATPVGAMGPDFAAQQRIQ